MKNNNNKYLSISKAKQQQYPLVFAVVFAVLCYQPANALTFNIDPNSDVVGDIQHTTVESGDSMFSIAHSFDVGLLELQKANPAVNPNRLVAGTKLVIPTQFILPPGPRRGMVINLAELRVYYYPAGENIVMTHPIGIGRLGWRTPVGETSIVYKRKDPTWRPPDSIRRYEAAKGRILPETMPPGPGNPLGAYAMNFGWTRYVIHGTNAPNTVGLRSSSGCIRMYAEDIENLFNNVPVGTKVKFIYEPFKVGVRDNNLYFEAHELFPEGYYQAIYNNKNQLLNTVVDNAAYPNRSQINWDRARELARRTHGYPVDISSASEADSTPGTYTSYRKDSPYVSHATFTRTNSSDSAAQAMPSSGRTALPAR